MMSRSLVAAGGFAFAVSLGEFGATSFIAQPDRPTLPTAVVRLLARPGAANFGQAMAMATILMVFTIVAVLVIESFRVGEAGDF
jgi:thiamine transport system permease protein